MTNPVARLDSWAELGSVVLQPLIDRRTLTGLLDSRCPGIRRRHHGRGLALDAFDAVPILDWPDSEDVLVWGDGVRRMLEQRRHVLGVHARLHHEVERLKVEGVTAARSLLSGARTITALDDHQLVNVAALCLPGSFGLCVFDEQGAGKTVTTVHAADLLSDRREMMTTLVVAPKSMVPEWQHEVERFMGDLYRVELLVGDRRDRMAVLARNPDIVVTNFEAVVSMEEELRSFLRRFRGRALLVVDESYNVKNNEARRTRAVRRLREEFDKALVLCGTPAPNAPHDLVAQLDIVDFGYTFRDVAVPDDRDAAVPVVREAIRARGLYTRHLKKDVLPTLPSKTFHRVAVALAPQQERAYRAALDDLILDLRSISDQEFAGNLGSYFARRARLLRLCSDPGSVLPGYAETPAKFSVLDELLDDWIGQSGEKVVVWSFYVATLDALATRYARYNPVRYDGSVGSVLARREAVRKFQDDATTMLFVANPATAGSGLTLHRARRAVYESTSNQAAHFLQSVDRIHRRGQDRDVEYVVLLCDGSVEETEFDRLLDKETRARDLLGDTTDPPVTRESMLTELLTSARRLGGVASQ